MRLHCVVFAIFLSLAGNSTSAQVFRARVEKVLIDVMVEGEPSPKLTKDDFLLRVDDRPREISYLGRDELPLAVALLIDSSRSVAPFFQELKEAAASLVMGLKSEDRIALYTTTIPTTRISELTVDRGRTLQALSSFQPLGGSAIIDGMDFAASDLMQTESQVRRAIIILSDDIDPSSSVPEYQLSRKLLLNEISVFEIKTKSVMPFPMKMRSVAGKRLPMPAATRSAAPFVRATGGKVISLRSPVSAMWGTRSLSEGFSDLRTILRSRYTLGFSPDPPAGKFHSIRIDTAKRPELKKLKLRYRTGYWDPP
ncbi:MAG TPA: VWA domain-containing protein [Acidobacteriota bacterium]|nr:VWA domain-containing protein [Acidobacteriota bacterium]